MLLTTKSVRRDYVTGTLYAMSHQSGYCKGEEGRVCVQFLYIMSHQCYHNKRGRREFVYIF